MQPLSRAARLACALVALAPAGPASDAPLEAPVLRVLPNPGDAGDLFGHAVDVDGGRLAVGAPWDELAGTLAGAVTLYEPAAGGFGPPVLLLGADTGAGDEFGHAVDLCGDTLAVAAWRADAAGVQSGAVYVFVREGTLWIQQAKLVGSRTAAGDHFGSGIALAGDRLVVGAWWHDTDGLERAGEAYVFERAGAVWSEAAVLVADDRDVGDQLGLAVALAGDRAAVGAWLDQDFGVGSGSAYVFERDAAGAWAQRQKLLPSTPAAGDRFGRSIALAEGWLVVGTEASEATGSAYVFERGARGFLERARLVAGDGVPGDEFGVSVAVDAPGEVLVVGAGRRHVQQPSPGRAYRFVRDGAGWREDARLVAADLEPEDHAGIDVALDPALADGRILVGADWSAAQGFHSGAAHVFERGPGPGAHTCENGPTSTGLPAWMDARGTSSLGANDLTLRAFPAPAGEFGMFVYAARADRLPLGNGVLCLSPFAPGIFRLPPQAIPTAGAAERWLDVAHPPPGGEVHAGETWFFQFWFRDAAAGGAGFDLSDGLAVTFVG